jgi:hypothetical protein
MRTLKKQTVKDYQVTLNKMDVDFFGGKYAVHVFCGGTFINEKIGLSLDAANEVFNNTVNEVGKYVSNQKLHEYNR